MFDLLARLYRTKMLLSAVLLVVIGTVLIIVGQQIDKGHGWFWLHYLPWGEFGGILVGAGVLSVWVDHFFSREQDALDEARLRRLLREEAPAMRDAVLDAFAANKDDLIRVATPETLDRIITNSLGLRLRDDQFAADIYNDIRAQAVSATERWHDAELSITLSPAPPKPARRQPGGPYFSVTVRWEYRTIPQHAIRRFVCLSEREEYLELATERGETSAWYIRPDNGLDVASPDAYELLRFTVEGEDQPIRRSAKRSGQQYSATVGAERVAAGEPVTISYTYRTMTRQAGHLLFFDIEQPTRNLRVSLDYAGCGISNVSALDLIPTVHPTRIERPPAPLPADTVRVDVDGWVFPRSGVAFVWTLEQELPPGKS